MKKEKLIGLLVVGIFVMSAFQVIAVSSKPTADLEKVIETIAESEPAFTTRKSGVVPLTTFDVRIHGDRDINIAADSYDPEILLELAEQALLHQANAKPAYDRNLTIGAEDLFIVYEAGSSIAEGRGLVFDVPFTLMGIGDHCYVWVHTPEIANATNNAPHVDLGTGIVNQTHVDGIIDSYDNVVFPNAYENFGMPNDVDNDPKIHIMVLDIAPDQTPDTGFTTGFHTWLNDDPEAVNPYWDSFSNQAEMIFLDTYPTIYEADYDTTGDGSPDTYYNMWDDVESNLNGWTTTLMNQTNLSAAITPVISGMYDGADLTDANTYYEVSVTATGLTYWAVEDLTNYTLNVNGEEIAITGYYGFTGADLDLFIQVDSTSHAGGVLYLEDIYTDLAGPGDLPTIGGVYEVATGDHVYHIKIVTGGRLAPIVTDLTDYVANTLDYELGIAGVPIDEAGIYTIDVTTGGNYTAVATEPVFEGTPTGTQSPVLAGRYIYDEDLDFYVKVTEGGDIRPIIPDAASGGALSTFWNGSHFVALDAGTLPMTSGTFVGTVDTDFVIEVVTGGLLGVDAGISLKFSTDAEATWSTAQVIEPNYPIRVLDSAGVWKGFTLDFSQFFYNLTAGDQFTIDAIAVEYPEVAFSTDGTNYGDSVIVPATGLLALNGTATGLLLDFAGVTEILTVDDVWIIETTANDAPLLEFSKDAGAIYANVTLTEDGFEVPYNTTMGTGFSVLMNNFNGYVVAGDEYTLAINITETVEIDFAVDAGAYTGTPIEYTVGDDAINITDSGFNVDFAGLAALTTDDVYDFTVINNTEHTATITFSNDGTTYANATVIALDSLTASISDQLDAVYGDLTVDFSDFTELVAGDQYNITLTGEVNPVVTVNATAYTLNTTNPMIEMGNSGLYIDFTGLDLNTTALEWNVTINDVTLNVLPEEMAWDLLLVDSAMVYTNWHLIDNGNDWGEEYFIRGGMPTWAIYTALGLEDAYLQYQIHRYFKYSDGQRFTVEGDQAWGYTEVEEGQSFLFLLYLYDHYGGTDFIYELSVGMTHGWDAIASALGAVGYRDLDVQQILMDFYLALYVDDATIPNTADYGGAGNQYAFASIDLMHYEWMEGYYVEIGNASSYEVLPEAVLTEVSFAWYVTYWFGKYGGGVPITAYVYDAEDGEPYAGSSDKELSRYLGASPKTYETAIYEFQNIPGDANLDLFFDGLDEQLFMDVDGTGAGDMWWSGDQKGVNPAGTAVATEPDIKYLASEVTPGSAAMIWNSWFQTEYLWDWVALEASVDSTDGEDGTWQSVPWYDWDTDALASTDYDDWQAAYDWPASAQPAPAYDPWGEGYDAFLLTGDAGHNSWAEAWYEFYTYLPGGTTYVRFSYMTDWGTQMKGMWVDHIEFLDGTFTTTDTFTFDGQADEGWFSIGNTLVDGSVLSGCGWLHPPASATPNNFMVAAIYTDMDAGYVEGSHTIYNMDGADTTEMAIIQRLAEERTADREQFTMIVIPTTEADAASEFTGGLYDADSTDTGDTLVFSLAPAEGLVEGAVMFQWPVTDVNPEVVHSIIIEQVSTGEKFIFYAPDTNTFVWRAGTWDDGDYTVQLRATYLDFMNLGIYTPHYEGQTTVAYSAVLEYSLENTGPTIVTSTATLEVIAEGDYENTVATYKFTIELTDASGIYSAWIYFSDDDGATYTLALLKEGANDIWSVEFDAASKEEAWDMLIDIHAQDTFNLKTIVEGITEDGAVHKPKAPAPGFEMIFALLALAGLSVILTRRRE